MDVEAGATRYAITILVYLSAVTIYGVNYLKDEVSAQGHKAKVRGRLEYQKRGDQDGSTRGANRTRFSTCSWLSASQCIFWHSQKPSIMRTG